MYVFYRYKGFICQLFSALITKFYSETVITFMKNESEDSELLFRFSKVQQTTVNGCRSAWHETFVVMSGSVDLALMQVTSVWRSSSDRRHTFTRWHFQFEPKLSLRKNTDEYLEAHAASWSNSIWRVTPDRNEVTLLTLPSPSLPDACCYCRILWHITCLIVSAVH